MNFSGEKLSINEVSYCCRNWYTVIITAYINSQSVTKAEKENLNVVKCDGLPNTDNASFIIIDQ